MSDTGAVIEERVEDRNPPLTLTAEDGPIELAFRDGRVEEDDAFMMPEK